MKTTISEVKKEKAQKAEVEPRLQYLQKLTQQLTSENARFRVELGQREDFLKELAGAVSSEPPLPRLVYHHAAKHDGFIVPTLCLSDMHIGEVIRRDETEGYGSYNWVIAQERMYGIIKNFLQWVEINRSFYRINECALFCLGDYISGDIHEELRVTNQFPVPVQVAKAGLLLGEVFRQLASHFKRLSVFEVGADNHGRLVKKPQFKQKTTNNLSYLVHTIANERASQCSNAQFTVADGAKLLASVNSKKFLLEHGDLIKAWSGFPLYGAQRMKGREANRRMNTRKGFDFWVMGHWHVGQWFDDNLIVNGSLSGTSELDHGFGRHADPMQVAFMVHQKHGLFNFTRFGDK